MDVSYALFFDVDGTLVSFRTHRVPESALEALSEAKAHGHRIFISTGRPLQWVHTEALAPVLPLADGLITVNGASATVGRHEVLTGAALNPRDVEILLEDALVQDYPAIVVGKQHIALFNEKPIVRRLFFEILQIRDFEFPTYVADDFMGEEILQISPFLDVTQEQAIMPRLSHAVSTRWHPAFSDVTAQRATKGNALRAVMHYLEEQVPTAARPLRSIAFGDGGNDISMLVEADIGVALGNAGEEVKQAADYTTASVDDDGIAHALRHFSVI